MFYWVIEHPYQHPYGESRAVGGEVSRERWGGIAIPRTCSVSDTDKGTLRKSAKRPRRGKQPVLLIVVRATADGWMVEAMADVGHGPEPLELMLTGELPPP